MNSRNFVTVTEPPVEPVTLSEVYEWLRLDPEGSPQTHPQDNMLNTLIKAARKKVEVILKRRLVQQIIEAVLDGFPTYNTGYYDPWMTHPRTLELLYPPLIEVLSVSYYDENNELQALASSGWFVSTDALPPTLNCTSSQVWPSTYRRTDAVRVRYVVGYPPDGSPGDGPDLAANVPEGIKQAIMIEVQLGYDELAVDKRNALAALRDSLLAGYKVHTE